MNFKKRILPILLALALAITANSMLSWTPDTVMAQGAETITITNASLYGKVKQQLRVANHNTNALVSSDDAAGTLSIDFDKVDYLSLNLRGINMTTDANIGVIQKLIDSSGNLGTLNLENANLNKLNFTSLNNSNSLTNLGLTNCSLTNVPALSLPKP